MSSMKFNSKSPTIKRILREASELSTSPSPDYHASPASDSDLFEWHFTLRGPPSSVFSSGMYHGRIVLPPTYPLRPPSFRFLTPSGRFETNREICLSISGHHEETWQPAWGIRTALVALRTFMETDAKGQVGGLDTNETERKGYAERSVSWKCPACSKSNEEILKECAEASKEAEAENGEGSKIEEVVPPELKIVFKPDNTESSAGPASQPAATTEAPPPTGNFPSARPVQGVPQPTGAVTPDISDISSAVVTPQPQMPSPTPTTRNSTPQIATVRQAQVSNDSELVWVDRAITGVVICLVFMVMKVFLGV